MPLTTSFPSEWDRQAVTWDEGIHSPKWPHYHYYKTFDIYLPRLLGDCRRVLELGCGTADSTISFANHADRVVATDFSKVMIRKASQKITCSDVAPGIDLLLGDAQNIPFKDKYFDGAFSRGALLNYVARPKSLLAEVHRVLSHEGKLVLDFIPRRTGGAANLYSKNQVEKMLKETGFRSIDLRPMGMFLLLWQNRKLMDFVNKHRDIFCEIEVEMAKGFRLELATMALVLAIKP
jgi:ubiquinone/menaquinone biosynthesis C-methylase UbiE